MGPPRRPQGPPPTPSAGPLATRSEFDDILERLKEVEGQIAELMARVENADQRLVDIDKK